MTDRAALKRCDKCGERGKPAPAIDAGTMQLSAPIPNPPHPIIAKREAYLLFRHSLSYAETEKGREHMSMTDLTPALESTKAEIVYG